MNYYFYVNNGANRDSQVRTEDLGVRQVNLDWDENGRLIGIEII